MGHCVATLGLDVIVVLDPTSVIQLTAAHLSSLKKWGRQEWGRGWRVSDGAAANMASAPQTKDGALLPHTSNGPNQQAASATSWWVTPHQT